MNTGIQDAVNLGWKLAAAVHGWAPPWLLDTYEAERHPVGARVLQVTDRFNQLVVGGSELRRWVWTLAISGLIRLRPTRHKLRDRLTGIGIAYPRANRRGSCWEGRRIPDLRTEQGRLYERMRSAGFLLVDMSSGVSAVRVAEPWADRVRTVRAEPQRELPAVMLIRPDGYVAWAGDEPAETAAALTKWCGQPSSLLAGETMSPLGASEELQAVRRRAGS